MNEMPIVCLLVVLSVELILKIAQVPFSGNDCMLQQQKNNYKNKINNFWLIRISFSNETQTKKSYWDFKSHLEYI